MKLNETTAMDVIRNPKSKNKIQEIRNHESQLRVFTEVMTEKELDGEPYWNTLMETMKHRSEKKFDRVKKFARYPLPVVQLCDSVLNDYFKVFEGKNRYFSVSGDRDIDRLHQWIHDEKPANWVEKQARKVFKNKPCSFVVVDRDDKGQPYLIHVDADRLVDVQLKDDDGNCEYICFVHSQEPNPTKSNVLTTYYSVYDDEHYFVYSKDSDDDKITHVTTQSHGIGWCPAKSFIRSLDSVSNPLKRRVAFSSALSKLEDWTMFDIFRNYVDHYAPFPITESPQSKCPNDDCEGGKVRSEIIIDAGTGASKTVFQDCEICKGSQGGQHIFPGTHIGIKVSADKDVNDGSGVFRMIFPDVDKLKYVPEKLDDLEMEIRYKTSGVNDLLSNEAVNKLQVKGSFANMESVLMRSKKELDDIYRFIVKTVSRLYYTGIDVDVEANFGTEWYLITEDDLQKRFDQAKKIGMPVEEMLNIYKELIETKYKGNPDKMERTLMLLDLDPFPMYSVEDCFKLKSESVMDDWQLSLKINFLKFISKFEAENVPITQFGIELDYWKRIEIITKELEIYNQEIIDLKNARNNPQMSGDGADEPQVTQEELNAQANLRGSVGGVQGILGIQASVAQGVTSIESAIATMIEIYGFNRETAIKILGDAKTAPVVDPATPEPAKVNINQNQI